jgi:hypothetical protein
MRQIVASNLIRAIVPLLVLLSLPIFAAAELVRATGNAVNGFGGGIGASGNILFTAPGGISGFSFDFGPIGITSVGQNWLPGTLQLAIANISTGDGGSFIADGVTYNLDAAGCSLTSNCGTGNGHFSGTLQVPELPSPDASGRFSVTFPVTVEGNFSGFGGCPVTGCPFISFNESGLGTAVLFLGPNALGQPAFHVSELHATFPAVPEPSTWLLLASGLGILLWYRRTTQEDES